MRTGFVLTGFEFDSVEQGLYSLALSLIVLSMACTHWVEFDSVEQGVYSLASSLTVLNRVCTHWL